MGSINYLFKELGTIAAILPEENDARMVTKVLARSGTYLVMPFSPE